MRLRAVPRPRTPAVFATASDALQVAFPRGPHRIDVAAVAGDEPVRTIEVDHGPGAALIDSLRPATTYRVTVSGRSRRTITATTLTPPRGEVIARVATMNDLHFGRDDFGFTGRIREVGSARLCAEQALLAAQRWGADHIVLKGDLTDKSRQEEWDDLKGALAAVGVPVHLMLGNHETADTRLAGSLAALDTITDFEREPLSSVDANGFPLFLADTTLDGEHRGAHAHFAPQLVEELERSGPALVLHHHQMTPWPNTYPRGIHGPSVRRFYRDVSRINTDAVFASGHTHRHRRSQIAGLTVTELGSTKDYPGTWCGYTIYEGGIEASVYRLEDNEAVSWLDQTGAAVAGVWAHWSPGRLRDRCWTQEWASARS